MIQSELWSELFSNPETQSVILACDLGGTKLGYGIFPVSGTVSNRQLGDTPLYANSVPTSKGKEALSQTFKFAVEDAIANCKRLGLRLLPHISMGSPGRFIGEFSDTIAPGSCVNLGTFPEEFDKLNLAFFLKQVVPEFVKLTIKNDAIAQMAAGIYFLQQDPSIAQQLLGQKLCYVGPGTGLGGGFCQVDMKGTAHYFSDGHIYDILISDETGQLRGAEDIFSGTAFKVRTGQSAADVNNSSKNLKTFEHDIVLMGRFLAELITTIYNGEIHKTNKDADWPLEDRKLASGTKVYLIGGSMGTKGKMGEIIQATAYETLKTMNLESITLLSIPDSGSAGLLGAANFLSRDELNSAWVKALPGNHSL